MKQRRARTCVTWGTSTWGWGWQFVGSDSGAPLTAAKFQELVHSLRFQGRPPSASLLLLPSSGSVTSLGILRETINDSQSTILPNNNRTV